MVNVQFTKEQVFQLKIALRGRMAELARTAEQAEAYIDRDAQMARIAESFRADEVQVAALLEVLNNA